jgi:hypothetical protein
VIDAMNPKGGYQKPFVIIVPILDHRDGHYVKAKNVAFKYHDFKKNVDPDVHVRMFNFVVKANAETSEEYIINAINYMLKDMASNWCHNYMSEFFNILFQSLHRHFTNVIERFRMTSKYPSS